LKYVFSEKLHTDVADEAKFQKLLKQISRKKPGMPVYLITEPLSEAAIYEIYEMNTLLQPYYRKMKKKLSIYGISTTKKGAREVLTEVIRDRFIRGSQEE